MKIIGMIPARGGQRGLIINLLLKFVENRWYTGYGSTVKK